MNRVETHRCTQCEKVFTSSQQFMFHIKEEHNQTVWCEVCKKPYQNIGEHYCQKTHRLNVEKLQLFRVLNHASRQITNEETVDEIPYVDLYGKDEDNEEDVGNRY